jgi:DNA-binding GntR family transcriptional regulator
MPTLGQIIREIQREAAALPTDALRHEIEMNLQVQDAIRQYCTILTVRRAVAQLRDKGLVITVHGRGSFVAPGDD